MQVLLKLSVQENYDSFLAEHTESSNRTSPPSIPQYQEPEAIPEPQVMKTSLIPEFQEVYRDLEPIRLPTPEECRELAEKAAIAMGLDDPQALLVGIADEELQRYTELIILILLALGAVAIVYYFKKRLTSVSTIEP